MFHSVWFRDSALVKRSSLFWVANTVNVGSYLPTYPAQQPRKAKTFIPCCWQNTNGLTESFGQEEHCAQLYHSTIKQKFYLLSSPVYYNTDALLALFTTTRSYYSIQKVWYERCKPQTRVHSSNADLSLLCTGKICSNVVWHSEQKWNFCVSVYQDTRCSHNSNKRSSRSLQQKSLRKSSVPW